MRCKKFNGLERRKVKNISNSFAFIRNLQCLFIIPFSMAYFAGLAYAIFCFKCFAFFYFVGFGAE